MMLIAVAIVACIVDKMDNDLIASYAKAVSARTPGEKYEIMAHALIQIRQKGYSAKRADAIGLLYASLLVQDMPKATKLRICERLTDMEGLNSSIDGIMLFAEKFRVEAKASPQVNKLRVDRFHQILKDSELVDAFIGSLQARKLGVSHMRGGLLFMGEPRH